jgi:hypothetical protein
MPIVMSITEPCGSHRRKMCACHALTSDSLTSTSTSRHCRSRGAHALQLEQRRHCRGAVGRALARKAHIDQIDRLVERQLGVTQRRQHG